MLLQCITDTRRCTQQKRTHSYSSGYFSCCTLSTTRTNKSATWVLCRIIGCEWLLEHKLAKHRCLPAMPCSLGSRSHMGHLGSPGEFPLSIHNTHEWISTDAVTPRLARNQGEFKFKAITPHPCTTILSWSSVRCVSCLITVLSRTSARARHEKGS